MKMLKQLIIYSFILLLLTNNSCIKEPTGDHTFSCYIDGKLFVPDGCGACVPYSDGLHYLIPSNKLTFSVTCYNEDNETFYFNIINWGTGTFTLQDSNGLIVPNDSRDINHTVVIINNVKYLSKEDSGIVTFTEASINGNTKGTFEFTLYNENDESDVIYITDGKFDD